MKHNKNHRSSILKKSKDEFKQLLYDVLVQDKEKLELRVQKAKKNKDICNYQVKQIKESLYYKALTLGMKLQRYIAIYFPLLLIIIGFTYLLLPLCFINNDYQNLVTAAHIDSGSILGSIIQIMNRHYFYDQTMGYHTSYYGFPYNSLVFWWFVFIKFILRLSPVYYFYLYAASARLFNFTFALLSIVFLYFLSNKIIKNRFLSFLIILGLAIYPGFSFYAFLIKPDNMALFFALISFYSLHKYIDTSQKNQYLISAIFGIMATFTKQIFFLLSVPIFIGFFLGIDIHHPSWKNKLKSFIRIIGQLIVIVLPVLFIINPFAFIKFNNFLSSQLALRYLVSASPSENIRFWLTLYKGYPIIIISIIIALSNIIIFLFFTKKLITRSLFLVSIYSFFLSIWLMIKIGPSRVEAYLIPFFGFLLLSSGGFIKAVMHKYLLARHKTAIAYRFFFVSIIFIITLAYIYSSYLMVLNSEVLIKNTYRFKDSLQVMAINKFIAFPPKDLKLKETKMVFTASIPVPYELFLDARNDWQFGESAEAVFVSLRNFQPDVLMIDYLQTYERPPDYWEEVATDLGLTSKQYYFLSSNEADFVGNNAIVVYYR